MLLDPYEPPFRPQKQPFQHNSLLSEEDVNRKLIEEIDRPPVTEDYEDSPFADRNPSECT